MSSLPAAVLQHHIDYSIWANRRLLEAAAALPPEEWSRDFGTADGSVGGTLAHIFAAERIWLARVQRRPFEGPFITESDLQMNTLEREWPQVEEAWRAWVGSLRDEDTGAAVAYADLRGRQWQQPLWQIVFHVVNHSTHHRGQVSGFLRAIGHKPPPLDFIAFVREQATAAGG
jgi:uncharacterized damage-inducible protein DinB